MPDLAELQTRLQLRSAQAAAARCLWRAPSRMYPLHWSQRAACTHRRARLHAVLLETRTTRCARRVPSHLFRMRINALVREAALGERIAARVGVVSPCRGLHTLAWTVEAAEPRTQLLVRRAPCTCTASRRRAAALLTILRLLLSLSLALSLSLPYPRACPCSHGVAPLHFFCSCLASFSGGSDFHRRGDFR